MADPDPKSPIFLFGPYALDVRAGELRKRGVKLKLRGQPLQVLTALLKHAGVVVTRDELRAEIWAGDTFVDFDHSLHNAVARLREVLDDPAKTPRFIETLPRRGYRFIGKVRRAESSPTAAQPTRSPDSLVTWSRGSSMRASNIIGRTREVAEICQELRNPGTRLLTLTGVGGAGKTTLSLAGARQVMHDFPDGVFFVNLAEVRTPELVIPAVAQAFGIKEGDAKPLLELLTDFLSTKEILLVLDNFEQVLRAGTVIAELLSSAPGLKVLVTSRSLLRLSSEREYRVPSLAIIEPTAERSPEELLRCDALKLFVDRAKAARPNLTLSADDTRTIAAICAHLDGLPLAIELAAARMKVLSPREISQRLNRRLNLLTGGASDLPARLRTMRGALDWSYELLTETEQLLFCRLGVFAGSFSLNSAECVVGTLPGQQQDQNVLDALTSLLNQSLLLMDQGDGGDARFRMLGVVREYALDRLRTVDEAGATQRIHAEYFLSLVEQAEPQLQGSDSSKWLKRLEEEYDNLSEALNWSLKNDFAMAVRFGMALRYYWDFMGHLAEGLRMLREILERENHIPATRRSKLYSMAGNLAKFQGDHQNAMTLYEQGLSAATSEGDLSDVSLLCRGLASLAVEQADYPRAQTLINEALEAATKADDLFGVARSLNMLGDLARSQGDDKTARERYTQALQSCRKTGKSYATANILNNLAAAEYGCGQYDVARKYFLESLAMTEESGVKLTGDRIAISYSLDGFAALAARRGDPVMATKIAGAAQRLRDSMNFNIESAEKRFRDSYLAAIRDALAEDEFKDAYEEGERLGLSESIAFALQTSSADASAR